MAKLTVLTMMFQHAAARRRLTEPNTSSSSVNTVSTRSRPKAADYPYPPVIIGKLVSTRSRPKAAEMWQRQAVA